MHAILSTLSTFALALEATPAARGVAPDLTWLMGVVAVLLLAISALAFGFRRVVVGAIKTRASKRDMQVLDVLPLGGKRQLAVVRCYDRTFALGLGEKSVDLVAELDGEAVRHDLERRGEERRESFHARLDAARARLLRTHELTPTKASGPIDPDTPREFVA